ncbi:MAG: ABC transporter permease [Bacteroidota bacterium]
MIKNYLKVALRNLLQQRVYSAINVIGLAVGLAACLLIGVFIYHEYSFDRFHEKRDRIYRLNEIQSFGGIDPQHVALTMYPMGAAMVEDYPEVIAYAQTFGGESYYTVGAEQVLVEAPVWTTPSFFELFDFPMLAGNPSTVFDEHNAAVLTEKTALAFYGRTDGVIGETFARGERTFVVTGVLQNVPETSHLQFDLLANSDQIEPEPWMQRWDNNWLQTYLLLEEGADPAALEAQFDDFITRYMGADALDAYQLYVQPLTDIHLGSAHMTHDFRNYKKFDRTYLYVFLILGLFVLVIAAINFMNLATARASGRAKEVGVRKAIGAHRTQLAGQFIGESVLLAVLALVLALGIAVLTLPVAGQLTERVIDLHLLWHPAALAAMGGATLLVGMAAGLYPAIFLSAFRPALVLKATSGTGTGGRRSPLRSVLVVTQFSMAIAMIIGTFLTVQQLRYMQNRALGFDKEQVLAIDMNGTANEKYETLKQTFRALPGVEDVTASGQRLGSNIHQSGLRAEGETEERRLVPSHLSVDANYFAFYGVEVMQGRAFEEARAADLGHAFVINEAMAAELGWEAPVGRGMALGWADTMGTVIGVVADFNFNSLHHRVQPLALSMQDWGFEEMSVRLSGEDLTATLTNLETTWAQLVPDWPFQYTFLDDHFATLYAADQQVSRVVGFVAALAILIACLGLFGLASITTQQRLKEVGIRKVLGASVVELTTLLSWSFARLVLLAFLIAAPATYLFMRDYLSSFAYRIDIGVGVFLGAGTAALLIALLTVAYRVVSAARMNPAKVLRYE